LLLKKKSRCSKRTSLFPNEDILTREIDSRNRFSESFRTEKEKRFMKMIDQCYKHNKAINAKGQRFPTEPLIMALLFSQHKFIEWLKGQISKRKTSIFSPPDL
ncbi:MAG: hypothetical protein M3044_23840, partial [Thermoproteota archaeon]|nr:hypothetical protein [Thermoproteota archaeon]